MPPSRLFQAVVPESRFGEKFRAVLERYERTGTRKMLEDVFATFGDIDPNFAEQFQTTGFDARIWELYLHAYFREQGAKRSTNRTPPDFVLSMDGHELCVEAVTVNPTQGRGAASTPDTSASTHRGFVLSNQDFFAIKFGSPLSSKLRKAYWKLPHAQNRPLMFAVEDFHDTLSMTYTSTALATYLYGVRYEPEHDENGKLIVHRHAVAEHRHGAKTIPSGFFALPDAEHVSAVLFSASGTLSKFTRMACHAGYCPPDVRVFRRGMSYRHNPDAVEPLPFGYELGVGEHVETWAEGISIFHNPTARHPLPDIDFGPVAHHTMRDDGLLESLMPPFHPYSSTTALMLAGQEGESHHRP